jgi:methionine-rich copper-binding protein CopC
MTAAQRLLFTALITGGALLGGCAAQSAAADTTSQATPGILLSSRPAAGATVSGPVNELVLRFSPPARLDEVTVDGSAGRMPMMIHSAAETADYSIPLPELGPGSYTVNWRATAQAKAYRGSVPFTVK